MEHWPTDKLPTKFIRYIEAGCTELNARLLEEPALADEIREVVGELLSRTPMEALDIEQGLGILIGEEPAKALVGCLRWLETYDEVEELAAFGYGAPLLRLIRYLVARYGPVLKAIRRRRNHPLGWHKVGHTVTTLENGGRHLHLKILRNDDAELVLEDDADSMLRLLNLVLMALDRMDDDGSVRESTLQEFQERSTKLIEWASKSGLFEEDGTAH